MNQECSKPDNVPNHVSIDRNSRNYFGQWKDLGVMALINGEWCVLHDTTEFNVSEGWYRARVKVGGKPKMERGKPVTVKLKNPFRVYWAGGQHSTGYTPDAIERLAKNPAEFFGQTGGQIVENIASTPAEFARDLLMNGEAFMFDNLFRPADMQLHGPDVFGLTARRASAYEKKQAYYVTGNPPFNEPRFIRSYTLKPKKD